jgi:WD40 repeat protein
MIFDARSARAVLGLAFAVFSSGCVPPPAPPPPPVHARAPAGPLQRSYGATGAAEAVFQVGGALDIAELSPDGLLLASSARDERAVRLWDVDRRAVVTELGMMPGIVRAIRWEGGGRWLLTLGPQGSVLYDGRTGRALANVPTDACAVLTSPPELVFWSPQDKGLAAVPFDGRGSFNVPLAEPPAHLQAAGGSRLLISFDDRTEVRGADLGLVATIAATGRVTPSADGAFAVIEHRVADLATGKLVLAVASFDRGLAWSSRGHALAYGDASFFHIWSGPNGFDLTRPVASPLTAIAWTPDDRTLAAIDLGNHLFTASSEGGPLRSIGTSKTAGALAFSLDGRKLTVAWDTLAIWDVARGEIEATNPSGARAVCPAGKAGDKSVLEVWRVGAPTPESGQRVAFESKDVGYAWHENERALETTCADGSFAFLALDPARLAPLEREAGLQKLALEGLGHKRLSEVHVEVTTDAIAALADGAIEVWDRASSSKRFRAALPFHVGQIAWSSDSALLAAVPDDGSNRVFVLDGKKGNIVRALDHGGPVRRAYFHPSQPLLVTSRGFAAPSSESKSNDEIRIFDAKSGRLVKKLPGLFGAWSPDGSLLSTVDGDAARTFDTKNFFPVATVKGKSMFAAFTSDSRGIFTPVTKLNPGTYDATTEVVGLELRDARTGVVILRSSDRVRELGESRDGARLVTLPAATADEASPSFFADLWETRDKPSKTRLINSLYPLSAPAIWDAGRIVATRSRGLLRLDRIAPRKTLWVAARALGPGRCEIAAFDESGRFDGPADDLIALRHGDELREAALETGPALAARRHPGLLREFFDGR